MDFISNEQFYPLFERMVSQMTDPEHFNRPEFIETLTALSELFHISKGVTEFYTSVTKENAGDGEILIDYDNGKGGPAVISRRIVTKSQAVIKGTMYRPEDEPPLSENDLARLDLCVRSILSFVSRNRLANVIERFGFYDETGYPNRRAFLRRVEHLCGAGHFSGNYSVALINLRHFALINEDIGRPNGDCVMRTYFQILSAIAGDDGIVSRLGGDNFLLIFHNKVLDRIIEVLRGIPVCYNKEESKQVMVSARAGIFTVPEDFQFKNPSDIFDKLFSSQQAAKQSPVECIVFYDEQMRRRKDRIMRIQQLFPPALAKREFRVYYQPKVDVTTGEIVGAEALCRWFHDGQMISPGDFIPVLEQTTDVCKLDFYMLDAVCADIRRWLDTGWKPVRISVNLSRKHLTDIDLLEHLLRTIDAHSIPHQYVEIELTETTTDVEFRDLKRVASGLQEAGIYTSVDDFGVGYSSLNLIREIPWNVLKIDRCFLPADDESETSVTSLMYRHVVSMALDMGLECITEGVETAKQIEILRDNNCRIAQGFIFDRPLPVEAFEQLLGKHCYDLTAL